MKKLIIYTFLVFALPLNAKVLISPINAMKYAYGKESVISKKNILLSREKATSISKKAKVKLKSKIFRIFEAKRNNKLLGYGILINKKVRSKNAVVIYFITIESILKSIEIIAFNEPTEYLPSKEWNSQFSNIATSKMLRTSKEIPTITGATLSARAVTAGSRLAFALYNEVLKDK